MKKLVLIALALFSLNSFAQSKASKKDRIKEVHQLYKDMTPEEIAKLRTKKMTLHLDLSDKQQKEVYNVLLEEATFRKIKFDKRKAEKKDKSEITKDDYLKFENEKLDRQIAMKSKMKDILNEEQYKKFEKSIILNA